MTYTGVLATILSGLEPAVAISLACIPLLRPLWGRKPSGSKGSSYEYNSSKQGRVYPKKGSKGSGGGAVGTFTELVYENDDSSEIQLQPVKPKRSVSISAITESKSDPSLVSPGQAITVEQKWEIRRE